MARSNSYSWMPGWLRKFLNLDDEMPAYGPSSFTTEREYSAPARPAASYTPPAPTFTPGPGTYTPPAPTYAPPAPAPSYVPMTQGTPAAETTPRFAASYSPPPAPASTGDEAPARGATPAPPPTPPRTLGVPGLPAPSGNGPLDGYVQPIGYGLRSFIRGALPPQGLEQFTREFRATLTDVWNFYSYWTRFQTDDLMRIGKEAADVVIDNLPSMPGEPGTASSGARRIKVTVGNGNGEKKVDRVATTTTIDPPPAPTPAAPPAPPAPTAKFSPTVTADDAQVPPAGRAVEPPAPPAPVAPPAPPASSAPVMPPAPSTPPPVVPPPAEASSGGPKLVKPKGRAPEKSGDDKKTE